MVNLEDLQPGFQGNWVNQIDEHFTMAPSLLGLKYIQLAAFANNDLAVSEEGLLLWKKHFQEQTLDNKSSFSANIPVSWFNFIVHLLLSPDKFDWTVNMLKSRMWELVSAVENMDFFYVLLLISVLLLTHLFVKTLPLRMNLPKIRARKILDCLPMCRMWSPRIYCSLSALTI